ncbi:MAG TPA: glycoside hydrolase family 57 protein [Acidiferrobacter sp.]|nr:glycoside hydrolase family 57 protein [Acidiferrobacter sp.]
MPDSKRLNLVLCWHMHQPEYRSLHDGRYRQPWVYLHGIKDYVDMAAHIEAVPEARAVVNFSPVLLDQIQDYIDQIQAFLGGGGALRDTLLEALVGQFPAAVPERAALIESCLRANKTRVIERFPVYQRLVGMAESVIKNPELGGYFSDQYLWDLVVWYHLAWLGETVRRVDARLEPFIKQGYGFDQDWGRRLLVILVELLAGLVPRYRKLAASGQVELSFTPYAHPIIPLMVDFSVARESQPDVVLPESAYYPDGAVRARQQIRDGQAVFADHFGFRPMGCWPAEGALSAQTLALLEDAGVRWTASGERVLRHTVEASGGAWREASRHRAYCEPDHKLSCFFRDDGLSDLIGFSYADWHADDAIANLIERLENIAAATQDEPTTLVSIIMDGENAWEYYPENGYYFLQALYQRLTQHPIIRLTTFSEYLHEGHDALPLPRLVAGSWVNGTLATWIGDPDKNRAWEVLVEAKATFDRVSATGRLSDEQCAEAKRMLAICEGSDWCWWFGDYNPSASVAQFDELYRLHIASLYIALGEAPPPSAQDVFTRPGVGWAQGGGVMRTSGAS